METDFVISRIDQIYLDFFKRDFKDFTKTKKIDFIYSSYARWALDEIKQYIIKNKNSDTFESLELFKYKMDCFACLGKNESSFMFSVAYDVTQFIIDELRTYNIM